MEVKECNASALSERREGEEVQRTYIIQKGSGCNILPAIIFPTLIT